ncbi:protein of unknown function [Chryseobacterium contaminans]|uniref:Thioredoxin domain-containing protein n=1 Tax=Chryseobacterium contaminans TaxID=1423959 RepID=A0A1M6Z1D1_9FLAO|nr:protein of unknown function [Chryseobacterium contaminans]
MATSLLTTMAVQTSAQNKFHIDGTVIGLQDGKIYYYKGEEAASIEVKSGKFHLDGDMEGPVSSVLFLRDSKYNYKDQTSFTSFYLEPKKQTLKLNYSDFRKSVLTGSKPQDDSYRFEAINDKIKKKYQKQFDKVKALQKKYDQVAATKDEKATEAVAYEIDDAKALLGPAYKEMTAAGMKFMKDNPKSFININNMYFYLDDMSYEEAIKYYNSFNNLYKNTKEAKYLLSKIEAKQKGVPGVMAGDFDSIDINGNPIKLGDFKGQYVLMDFWASWCIPCRKGNPHLLKIYNTYKSKGLEIVGVADDDNNQAAWRKAVEKDGIGVWKHTLRGLQYKPGTHQQINKDKDISDGYNVSSLPTKILIGPDGKIVARYNGGEEDDRKMDADLEAIFASK